MKTIFTLFASLLLSVSVMAAAKSQSMVTIRLAGNDDIRVVLDGKRFESNDNSILIRDVAEGVHQLKVYREKRNGLFNLLGRNYELVYNSTVRVKKQTHLSINISNNGRAAIQETRINGGWGNGRNENVYDYDRDGRWGDYDYNEARVKAMPDREFKSVLSSIEKEWLESNKLKSATQVVRANRLTVAQVEQMLLLFSFENNKLQLAKQAYENTVDKRNYHRLYDVFSFQSSKRELERYISGK